MTTEIQGTSWERISTTTDGRPVYFRELPGGLCLTVTRKPGQPWHWQGLPPEGAAYMSGPGYANADAAKGAADYWAQNRS